MSRKYSYSVCIATYNGEKYIEEQVNSILSQLGENDEIVVSDDGSKDNTIALLEAMKKEYPMITIVKGPQMGFSCNFENAVKHASKDIIVFSDQDDIWKPEKIARIDETFAKNPDATTILHTMSTFRGTEEEKHELPISYHQGVFKNLMMSSYWGCCMAVKREFLVQFVPFREYCIGHDQLTGLMTEKYGKNIFIDEDLIMHRLHDSNTSFALPFVKKIKFRLDMLREYLFTNRQYKRNMKKVEK